MDGNPSKNPTCHPCSECGREMAADKCIVFGGKVVCVDCKSVYLQKFKEGALKIEVESAGIGVRILALLVDFISVAVLLISWFLFPVPMIFLMYGINLWISFIFFILYYSYALSRYGATLGKLTFGIRVTRTDGSRPSFTRASARFFVQFLPLILLSVIMLLQMARNFESPPLMSNLLWSRLSNACFLIFLITNLGAIFDKQDRALHDWICDTRVVLKSER